MTAEELKEVKVGDIVYWAETKNGKVVILENKVDKIDEDMFLSNGTWYFSSEFGRTKEQALAEQMDEAANFRDIYDKEYNLFRAELLKLKRV